MLWKDGKAPPNPMPFALRDEADTGAADNPLGLPADPYELGYAVQERMFYNTGELFYSAFPGDPFYDDFITDEGELPPEIFPGGGPTALAEFFGDHLDLIIDFNNVSDGSRVIVENLPGDAPFGGDLPDPDPEFRRHFP